MPTPQYTIFGEVRKIKYLSKRWGRTVTRVEIIPDEDIHRPEAYYENSWAHVPNTDEKSEGVIRFIAGRGFRVEIPGVHDGIRKKDLLYVTFTPKGAARKGKATSYHHQDEKGNPIGQRWTR